MAFVIVLAVNLTELSGMAVGIGALLSGAATVWALGRRPAKRRDADDLIVLTPEQLAELTAAARAPLESRAEALARSVKKLEAENRRLKENAK